jgi:hypothetical protein
MLILWLALLPGCWSTGEKVYLFSYFTGNGEDGLHLAASFDGLDWMELRPGCSFLVPEAGKDRLMRDPCIIRGGDGLFHMVWTVGWNDPGIGYSCSADLVHWSKQRYIPVMEHIPGTRNCWAPELFYDAGEERYLLYWASTVSGRFPETDSTGDDGYNHRIYFSLTEDFREFSEAEILYDQGFNVIDATLQKAGESYVMFLKDETRWPEPEKNIRFATSDKLTGPYSPPSKPITGNWVEGPTALKTPRGWILYFDCYREQRMGAVTSKDLEHWSDISEKIRFPEGTRHGSVLRITRKELESLMAPATSARPAACR